ncbi:hypothetical protein C5F49_07575 [Nitrosopumilus oxyclinae]|uniref:Uncharacterized protein n=1 Tax=Nitrosopumilus oxyclinae TaxID=1959104 RepID=A0A7D5R463_9ARCH|nr:hypothetical protein [Nitrosopumilus oxyclinae]QLH05197.1 hypothetical protein C5F49_07575 [Nitrosopumilus oxyclinae]
MIANTVLAFFFPTVSSSMNVDFSGNDSTIFQNLSSYLLFIVKIITNLAGFGSLIAGIAIYLQDKRTGTVSYFSVPNRPVDITRQTIFAFIPGLDLYASYKVKKLTIYILVIFGIAIPAMILVSFLPDSQYNYLLVESIVLPVAIYLIRKWSKKWNDDFMKQSRSSAIQ